MRSAAWSPGDSAIYIVTTGPVPQQREAGTAAGQFPGLQHVRANADDMLITSAGLWIASSNRYGSQYCGRVPGHSGILPAAL